MTALATLTAAQSRIDDGHARPGDHDCSQRLDDLLQAAAHRLLDDNLTRERLGIRARHDAVCDGDGCRHYDEPREG